MIQRLGLGREPTFQIQAAYINSKYLRLWGGGELNMVCMEKMGNFFFFSKWGKKGEVYNEKSTVLSVISVITSPLYAQRTAASAKNSSVAPRHTATETSNIRARSQVPGTREGGGDCSSNYFCFKKMIFPSFFIFFYIPNRAGVPRIF